MPVATKSYADIFAANWKAQNPSDDEDDNSSLDDSLTNLQWLHSINIQDITANNPSADSAPSPSSNSCDSDDQSESGDSKLSDRSSVKEQSIDYKNDPRRKPPYSYATLICMAMQDTKKSKITLSAIYKWIKENFMYYRMADPTWQNSIRHNLSLNKCFIKVARKKDEPGKGGFWKIDPAFADMFVDGVFKRRRGVNTHKSSKKCSSKNNKNFKPNSGKSLKKPEMIDTERSRKRNCSKFIQIKQEPLDDYEYEIDFRAKTSRPAGLRLDCSGNSFLLGNCMEVGVEEELPPFSGDLKGGFSWNSVLANDEIDESIRDIADAHGIRLDSPFQLGHQDAGRCTPGALSPPPSTGSGDEFQAEPDLDLTVRGIGIFPTLTTPTPTALTEGALKYMPPSPPPILYEDDHPWAENGNDSFPCFDLDENNNAPGIWP